MTQKTKTIKKQATTTDKSAHIAASHDAAAVIKQTNDDIKTAILIVSLTLNAFVLIGWITLQVTTTYDYQVAAFLFSR